MLIFFKKFFRELRDAKGQFFSVLAVVVLGVMFFIGLNTGVRILSDSSRTFNRDYQLADLWLSVHRAPEAAVSRIAALPGVKKAAGRIVKDTRLSLNGSEISVRLISMPDEAGDTVNGIALRSGSYFSGDANNQCLVSDAFLKSNGLKIGGTLEPILGGDRVKLGIVGTAQGPEYCFELAAGSMVANPKQFGVVFVKSSYMQSLLDFSGSVNDIGVLLEDGADAKQVKTRAEKILEPYGWMGTVEKPDQRIYNTINNKLTSLGSLSTAFPLIFFIASAVIIYITMTRMIENQRTQIGVLKSLGYGKMNIVLHYQTYPVVVGVLGCILGDVLGTFVIGNGLAEVFNAEYRIPIGDAGTHAEFILPAVLLALTFCVAAGYNACRKELKTVPAQSMRPKPPIAGRKIFLEYIESIWRRVSFSGKIIVRNIFRYKRRSAMASVGIIFSIALILVALGLEDSLQHCVDTQFSKVEKYDVKVVFSKILSDDDLNFIRSMDTVQIVEPALETSVEATNGWVKEDIPLIALEQGATLYNVMDRNENPMKIPKDGVLLSDKLLGTLHINPSQTMDFRFFYLGVNSEKDRKKTFVAGSAVQYMGQYAICDADYLKYFLKAPGIANVAFIRLKDPGSTKETVDRLKDMATVSNIQTQADSKNNIVETLASMNSMIAIMILGACILGFVVIYNITNITIFERRREIATLLVLGFKDREIKRLVFNENFFFSSFGCILGIPLGRVLLGFIVQKATTDTIQLPVVLSLRSYAAAVCIIFISTVIANAALSKRVMSIDMVESLKSIE